MNLIPRIKSMLLGLLLCPYWLLAQNQDNTAAEDFNLEQCIEYALTNRPLIEQARIDQSIGDRQIRANLSAWLPQISAQYTAAHNIIPQRFVVGDQIITNELVNNSTLSAQADQTLFNRDVLLAAKGVKTIKKQLEQATQENKINTVVDVSKAFYDVLLTQEQLKILDGNILRLEKQYKDARSQYESGLVDRTDYQRASITLANTRSDRKRTQEAVKAKYAALKEVMGFPVSETFALDYNRENMESDAMLDTTQVVRFPNHIEFQQLQTEKQLQVLNTNYSRWAFLPSASAYINYSRQFFSENLPDLYNTPFPTSVVGLRVALPIFQGGRRVHDIQVAQLQQQRLQQDEENLTRIINTEYETSLANYKSEYFEWETLKDNMETAQQVYNTIKLQYDEGIRPYVDLIVSENELRTAQLNYFNALFNVLSSKLDYQRALGNIYVN